MCIRDRAWTRDGLPEKYSLDVLATDAFIHLELDPEFKLTGRSDGQQVEATSRQDPRERSIVRFIEAARESKPERVFCSPAAALGTLAVAIACEEALSSGGTVPLATS